MGSADPAEWVRSKRTKLRTIARGEVARHTRAALAVCMPSVPVAAALGFALNGDPYNTTGWLAGDQAERDAALRKGRRPFIKGDPTKGYGAIGSDDLHELGWFGVEGGHCPTAVATDPDCPWVRLADSDEVVKILGRAAPIGRGWYRDVAAQCAVGVANLLRHMRQIREALDPRLSWPADRKAVTLWQWSMACISWSAGTGRAARHVNAYAAELSPLEERLRVGEFMRLAAAIDDDGSRHRQDEYSALRDAQKREGGRAAAALTGEGDAALAFLDDGLGADRPAVHARLVETSLST